MSDDSKQNHVSLLNRIPEIAMNSPIIGYDLADKVNELPFLQEYPETRDNCFCGEPITNHSYNTCTICGCRVHHDCYPSLDKQTNPLICIQCQQKACNQILGSTIDQIRNIEENLTKITEILDQYKTPANSRAAGDIFGNIKNGAEPSQLEISLSKTLEECSSHWKDIIKCVENIQDVTSRDLFDDEKL
ncbi:hypothetical protein TVAG_239890 [Trichomonas vaginalis G3]|uniref:Uncharacterized protein n=1 Tax=Trichomonas vaginalis (strain ATCC PRA-98 / G3) TaxID=412133 RepID=A2EFD2_TRIV3|nr:hypothetical protein TVAGG3_0430870 [Trichomonas vaginalis G3]EAY08629.1 hypothetical protein TVAG_239890 [Trichomonas vaginalis G3]KAI5536742.1 hypothetical protein TVAGG3_0430870 [Trichomonas vaginalis G3]|eukprot:XP_001320852.1 hypothetical protein [Trichomonas vaginalis G3]